MRNISIVLTLILLGSCVSQKKYETLLSSKDILQKDFEQLKNSNQERLVLTDSMQRVNRTVVNLTQEVDTWKSSYQSLYATNEQLKQEITTVKNQNEQLQNTATANNESLRKEIADRMRELDAREKDLRMLESDIKSSQGTVNDLKKFLSEKELKIKDLNDALTAKDKQMTDLTAKISEILRGFNTNELTVRQENGRIYVALSDNLLFAKGSTVINARGIEAVKKLALPLSQIPDVDIQVEGHTDNDGSPDQNWSLSTARALSIVKILTTNKIEPKRILASGRAFYSPIAPNDSEINKAKNRRTEIILSPQLAELYNIIKN